MGVPGESAGPVGRVTGVAAATGSVEVVEGGTGSAGVVEVTAGVDSTGAGAGSPEVAEVTGGEEGAEEEEERPEEQEEAPVHTRMGRTSDPGCKTLGRGKNNRS